MFFVVGGLVPRVKLLKIVLSSFCTVLGDQVLNPTRRIFERNNVRSGLLKVFQLRLDHTPQLQLCLRSVCSYFRFLLQELKQLHGLVRRKNVDEVDLLDPN
jgi:hypothetical protein